MKLDPKLNVWNLKKGYTVEDNTVINKSSFESSKSISHRTLFIVQSELLYRVRTSDFFLLFLKYDLCHVCFHHCFIIYHETLSIGRIEGNSD